MAPKGSVEILSRKTLICLTVKICASDSLHSGLAYCAVGHEFNVTESTIYIKQSIVERGCVLIH